MHKHRMEALRCRATRRTEEEEAVDQNTHSTNHASFQQNQTLRPSTVNSKPYNKWQQAFKKAKDKKEVQDSMAYAMQVLVKDHRLKTMPRTLDQIVKWNPKEAGSSKEEAETPKHHVKLRNLEQRQALRVALEHNQHREGLHLNESEISVRLALNIDFLAVSADDKDELKSKLQGTLAK